MPKNHLATLLALFSAVAYAHPGEHHGGIFSTLAHLLSEPDHLILAMLAVVAGVGGAIVFRRRSR